MTAQVLELRQCCFKGCTNPAEKKVTYDNGDLAEKFGMSKISTELICKDHFDSDPVFQTNTLEVVNLV